MIDPGVITEFILSSTCIAAPPLVPELRLRLARHAYDIFIPPTPEQIAAAHAALVAIGTSIDKFSAHAMRHVAECVGKIADIALSKQTEP